MTDIPENVDLNWIARHIVEMRGELSDLRQDLRMLRQDVVTLREDMDVMTVIVRRVDRNLPTLREDVRQLFEMHRDLRRRVEALEKGE